MGTRPLTSGDELAKKCRRARTTTGWDGGIRASRAPVPGIGVTHMFETILTALVERGVQFVLIGGVAATVHGSARFTNDIDICYETSEVTIDRLVILLTEWNAYLRGVEPGLPFILDARTFRTTPIMTLTTSMGAIDLLDRVSGVGAYADALAQSETVRVGATEFRSLTLEALIASKKAVRRRKDMEHLIELEAILALRNRAIRQP